jgi:hypothetical protein
MSNRQKLAQSALPSVWSSAVRSSGSLHAIKSWIAHAWT